MAKQRDGLHRGGAHHLHGLLPPAVLSEGLQERIVMESVRSCKLGQERYMVMFNLQENNRTLFYKILINNAEELLPVFSSQTVGEACGKHPMIFGRPRGLYISVKDKGRMLDVLKNWPEKNVQIIVVTDGHNIGTIGDIGCQGMGIPVAKLALYSAFGGIDPSSCLAIVLDVGTNNDALINDETYIGLKQPRLTDEEFAGFMTAVKENFGDKVCIQLEGFAIRQSCCLLSRYRSHFVFNNAVQEISTVVLAGLLVADKIVGKTIRDHTYLFVGSSELLALGIADLIVYEILRKRNVKAPQMRVEHEVTRKKFWFLDSEGLLIDSRKDSLEEYQKPWAQNHGRADNIRDAIRAIKPTVLIGTSGRGQPFTEEVIEAISAINERPIIFALSSPPAQCECTAEQAYTWSKGKALFASKNPFSPVQYDGTVCVPSQVNSAYIFPGFGLGAAISGAVRCERLMFLAAAEALAEQTTVECVDRGVIYPPFSNIKKISAHVAAAVAKTAYQCSLESNLPQPEDLVSHAESCVYNPSYN